MTDHCSYHPSVNRRLADFIRAGACGGDGYPSKPFAADVRAGKGTSFYRAHTYHTKVPPQGIEQFIAHYTRPGQSVLDPFCGSGMTGIAAVRQGRRALLCDLSPAATFFAFNHCRPLDVDAFLDAGRRMLLAVEKEFGWLYATRDRDSGLEAQFEKLIWSQSLGCPACGGRYSLWDAALDGERNVRAEYPCPHCAAPITKKSSRPAGRVPIRVDYGSGGRAQAPVDPADLALIERIDSLPWPGDLWFPRVPVPERADEIRRLHNDGIATVAELFTKRNLLCIAALWREAGRGPARLRPALQFAVTGIMQRASRLNKFIPSLNISPGPILGTMYIPGFYPETNALQLFRRKLNAIAKCHRDLRPNGTAAGDVCVSTQSATDLSNLPDESIDYVFTDPPFGSNIQYSELNLLWESWLGTLTDTTCEAVMNRSQGKDVAAYGELMARAFAEIRRVLRTGAWLTLVFHNSSGEVWSAIQRALAAAGLSVRSIATFDKAHDTFKMVTAPNAVGFDVVVNCRKTGEPVAAMLDSAATIDDARELVRALVNGGGESGGTESFGSVPPSPRKLHSLAIAHFMRLQRPIAFDFSDFRPMAQEELSRRKAR